MEPVTHLLTGACLARSGFNRKTAYATLAMTLAAEAPDLDMLWGFRGPVAELQHHRGITHSLIFAPVMALFVTALVWLFDRSRPGKPPIPARWVLLWLFAILADLSHLALDYTNSYGLRPFFPFSSRWHAWSIVFIFDPWIFLALLLALIVPWILGLADREIGARRQLFRGRAWAICALGFVLVWWGVRNAEHLHALALVRTGDYTREPLQRVAAEPHMFSPFHWHVLIETQDYYQTAEVDTLSGQVTTSEDSRLIYKPHVTAAVAAAKQTYLGKVWLDWSKWPLLEDRGPVHAPGAAFAPDPAWHTIEFQDLRFGYAPIAGDSSQAQAGPPLSGWVYVAPNGEIEGMFLSGREQSQP